MVTIYKYSLWEHECRAMDRYELDEGSLEGYEEWAGSAYDKYASALEEFAFMSEQDVVYLEALCMRR